MKIAIVLLLVMVLNGCSIYSAATAPKPVAYETIAVDTPRQQVLELLGKPSYQQDQQGQVVSERFHFVDGYNAAYKSRVGLYLLGGLATAGLSEFIFWPMEANLMQGQKRQATVMYDNQGQVKSMVVTDDANNVLLTKGKETASVEG